MNTPTRAVALAISLLAAGCASKPTVNTTSPKPPPILAHTLVTIESSQLKTGTLNRAVATTQSTVAIEQRDAKGYPITGTWTSGQIATRYPFTELLPSWNLTAPDNTGATLDVRVRDAKQGDWSPWLFVQSWGKVPRDTKRVTEFAGGEVEVDILSLKRPADAFELRATLYTFDVTGTITPELRRASVVYSKPVASEAERQKLVGKPEPLPAGWVRDLAVPYRPQGDLPKSVRSDTCSPTSVAMVMAYQGVDEPTATVAQCIYDADYDLFGNWGRAITYPSTHGLSGEVVRISTMDEARAYIASGQPLIASIRYAKGEFPSSLAADSDGHLIVIRGFTSAGDAIVNDPGHRARGNGVVYKADELAKAWIANTGGVTYVIRGRQEASGKRQE
jgi:hypothetical protein